MKAPLSFLVILVSALALGEAPRSWPSLKLITGKEYKDVKVSAVEPGGLKIIHATGFARIPYEQLPVEIQKQFAFDPTKAAEQRTKEAAMREKAVMDADDAARKAEALKLANSLRVKLEGEVLQIQKGGVLLTEAFTRDELGNRVKLPGESAIVACTPDENLADGNWVAWDVYPMGTQSYTTTLGAKRTVRSFAISVETFFAWVQQRGKTN